MTPAQIAEYARMMRAEGVETLELDGVRIRLGSAVPAQAPAPKGKQQTPAEAEEAREAEAKRLMYAHTGRKRRQ